MQHLYPKQEVESFNGAFIPREAIAKVESRYEPQEAEGNEFASPKPVILVTPEQYAWLESVSSRTGKTFSYIMRSLIADQMERDKTFPVGYFDGDELISQREMTEAEYQAELKKADEMSGGNIAVIKLQSGQQNTPDFKSEQLESVHWT